MSESVQEPQELKLEERKPTEIEPAPFPPLPDIQARVANAAALARLFEDVLQKAGHIITIAGRRYVTAQGWQALAGVMGYTPKLKEYRIEFFGREPKYVAAEVEILRKGEVVASAVGVVHADEFSRLGGEAMQDRQLSFAVSFAQTRAVRKALSMLLGHVFALARIETEAEAEIVTEQPRPQPLEPKQEPVGIQVTADDWRWFWGRMKALGLTPAEVRELLGVESVKEVVTTKEQMAEVVEFIEYTLKTMEKEDM